jgi:hypothetical protein
MWFWTVVDRRAEAAAVNAMASGSQHSTMRRRPAPFKEDDFSDSGEL